MATIAKSKDTANYRKGKDIQVGDVVRMVKLTATGNIDYSAGYEFLAVATVGKDAYGAYRMHDVTGTWTRCVRGQEFAEGRY